MSNSAKMTLEEKLVDRIKTTELASLIDDEDSITSLTKRAITEALFTERKEFIGSGYSQTTKIVPSAVQQAANETVQIVINSLMADLIAKVLSNPETVKAMNHAVLELLPMAILRTIDQQVINNYRATQFETMSKLRMIFQQAGDQAAFNSLNNIEQQGFPGPYQSQTSGL